jgi:rhodanese-related sulfurtransferase
MKYLFYTLVVVGALFLINRLLAKKNRPYTNIKSEELEPYLKDMPDAILLDVRTPKETNKGKIPGAIEMDFYSPSFRAGLDTLDKEKAVIVYCHSGVRSARTAYILDSLGFQNLYNLKKGYKHWSKNKK